LEFNQVFGEGRIIDLASSLNDFHDTAAAVLALDAIVAVDTSIAHVAGALGKPTFLMLPYSADLRWLLNRDDSPWYPTLRLFRQEKPGDWTGVVQRIEGAITMVKSENR
jgi:ADP-heptose:LPS heptosyltransferase